MNRLFLHIGTHKTGTTTVQRFFDANRESVQAQGYVYPQNSIGGLRDHYAHHRIAHAIAGRPDVGTPDDAQRFFDALRSELAPGQSAVVSAEALYRHVATDPSGLSISTFDAGDGSTGDPLSFIRRVKDCIGDFDVTIMVMLRRQDLFLESLYAEQVMSSSYSANIGSFLEKRGWLADYEQRLGMWAEVFGENRISVRLFEPEAFGMPVEQFFLTWLGGTWNDQLTRTPLYNATIPRSLVEFKRTLNNRQPRKVSTIYRRWLEQIAEQAKDGSLPDIGSYFLTYAERNALLEHHAETNRNLARRYFDRDQLFTNTDTIEPYDDPTSLSNASFKKITRQLMRFLADR